MVSKVLASLGQPNGEGTRSPSERTLAETVSAETVTSYGGKERKHFMPRYGDDHLSNGIFIEYFKLIFIVFPDYKVICRNIEFLQ